MTARASAFALRTAEAMIEAAPTLLVGLVVAGLLRWVLGARGTRRLFGEGAGWRSLAQAWAIGMALPLCSVGVIPVLVAMRRAGVRAGTILAFGLTAPLFNPMSVLYGLTFADPGTVAAFSIGSLVVVSAVGGSWNLLPGGRDDGAAAAEPSPSPDPPQGAKRMVAVVLHGAWEMTGPTAAFVTVGLLGSGALAFALPAGSLGTAADPNDPWAPLTMAAVAAPAYSRPMTAMAQLASMLQHGNSIGAAFALLALGAGVNLGVMGWLAWRFGLRRTVSVLVLLVAVVLALAYGIDRPLRPPGVRHAGHTHAFDGYCAPARLSKAWVELEEGVQTHQALGLALVCGLVALGLATRRWGGERLGAWVFRRPSAPPRFDRAIPAPVLGAIALAGLVASSVLACLLYYPPPRLAIDELENLNVEVCGAAVAEDWEAAAYWLPLYREWIRRFHVGAFLRGRPPTDFQRAKAAILQDKIEALKHAVEDADPERARRLSLAVDEAFRRLRRAHEARAG